MKHDENVEVLKTTIKALKLAGYRAVDMLADHDLAALVFADWDRA